MHAQVGPRGVHLEKDNVFNSQAYAAGAPAITISNDPNSAAAAGSTGSTAAAGTYPAAAQPSTSSTIGNGQSVYGSSQGAQNAYGSSSTDPTATPSGFSVGRHFMLTSCPTGFLQQDATESKHVMLHQPGIFTDT